MKALTHFLKKAFSKWWVKWPFVLIASLLLLVAVYLLSFNSVTRSQEKAFVAKWEPLIGSLKYEDIFPSIREDEDLAKDPIFIKLTGEESKRSWFLMSFIGDGSEEDEYKAIYPDHNEGKSEIDLSAWYGGEEGLSNEQIATSALKKLTETGEDIRELELLLDKYQVISSSMNGLEMGKFSLNPNSKIKLISLARVFSERALLHAYTKNGKAVLRDFHYLQKLRNLAGSSSSLIGLLVERAISASEQMTLKYCLKQQCFDVSQLRKLLVDYKLENASQKLAATVRGEYAYVKALTAYIETRDIKNPSVGDIEIGTDRLMKLLPNTTMLSISLTSLEFQLDKMYYSSGKLVDRLSMTQYRDVEDELKKLKKSYNPRSYVASRTIGVYVRQIPRALEWQAQMEMGEIGLACELYKLEHESYPNSLHELVPNYLKTLQKDPFGKGGDYRYSPAKDHFMLYSLGENEQDDKGQRRTIREFEKIDLIWGN